MPRDPLTVFYHFSCSDRRNSIEANGLVGGSTANLNENPTNNLYFVWYPPGDDFASDRKQAEFVLCMVKDKCHAVGGKLDVWRFINTEDVITRHTIKGEFRLKTPAESPIVAQWSAITGGRRVRVPPERLRRVPPASLPSDLKPYVVFDSPEDDFRCRERTRVNVLI